MKAIRTVQKTQESNYEGTEKPKFKEGDYLRVYCGRNEGCYFYVKEVRYNHDTLKFEYLYEPYGWYPEGTIVVAGSRQGWHYDS